MLGYLPQRALDSSSPAPSTNAVSPSVLAVAEVDTEGFGLDSGSRLEDYCLVVDCCSLCLCLSVCLSVCLSLPPSLSPTPPLSLCMYYTCTCKCACICTYVYSLDAYLNRLAQPFRWLGSVWGFKQDTSGAICREDVKGTEAGAEQVEGRTRLKAAAVERGQQKGSRVSALDRTRSGLNGGQWAAEGKGELLFENVTFCYPSRPQHVALDSVSLRVPGGLTVAVVGSSGCGKSTLFALALRFYAPRSGRITLDGVDLQDVPEATLRRAVAWVPQEPPIFANRTVMENMAYGRSMVAGSAGPGLAELEPAARAANAWEYICKLPQGLNTMLGEGTALSGGQKQRLALAGRCCATRVFCCLMSPLQHLMRHRQGWSKMPCCDPMGGELLSSPHTLWRRPGSLISLSSWTVGRSLNTDLTRSCWIGTQCTHVCLAQEHPFLQALGREARTFGRGMQRRFLHQEEGGGRVWMRGMYGAVAAEL